MCNDFGNRISYRDYVDGFSHTRLPVRFDPPAPNFEPRDEIWPTENAPVVRMTERGPELSQLRWGLAAKLGAKPVINMRSEGKPFEQGRCLVLASQYFEFTGTKSPKIRWRFTRTNEDWFCFAGLTGKAVTKDGEVRAFSLLTAPPGPDTAPYHDREPVILARTDWRAWLEGGDAAKLLHSSRPGSLTVTQSPREKQLFG
ncbi:MAG TPA: SOS response-associated peptidase family protein [Rhizomicrobium sp.]|nr:SOS response-associated peptidase family protein [Rhizomicrobium sp.]